MGDWPPLEIDPALFKGADHMAIRALGVLANQWVIRVVVDSGSGRDGTDPSQQLGSMTLPFHTGQQDVLGIVDAWVLKAKGVRAVKPSGASNTSPDRVEHGYIVQR